MDLILLQPGDTTIVQSPGPSFINAAGNWNNPFSNPNTGGTAQGAYLELVSLHQGMKKQVTTDVSNGARTSGRPIITEFTCTKYVDPTSTKLYDYCLRAKPIGTTAKTPTYIYILRNSGEQMLNIMTYALRDALISEIQLQTHPDDMPTEQFKINFTEILWTFTIQNSDVTAGGVVPAGWSLLQNGPITAFTS